MTGSERIQTSFMNHQKALKSKKLRAVLAAVFVVSATTASVAVSVALGDDSAPSKEAGEPVIQV